MNDLEITTLGIGVVFNFDYKNHKWDLLSNKHLSLSRNIRTGFEKNHLEVIATPRKEPGFLNYSININGKHEMDIYRVPADPGFVGLVVGYHTEKIAFDNFKFEELFSDKQLAEKATPTLTPTELKEKVFVKTKGSYEAVCWDNPLNVKHTYSRYHVVGYLLPGELVEVLARFSSNTYFMIETPSHGTPIPTRSQLLPYESTINPGTPTPGYEAKESCWIENNENLEITGILENIPVLDCYHIDFSLFCKPR